MKKIIFSLGLIFTMLQVQAQCNIASIKVDSYGMRAYDSNGNSQIYQYDEKCIYDYSPCWLAVVKTGDNIKIYDGKSNATINNIYTHTSAVVKSIKILGDKVRVEYEGEYNPREYDIK